MSTAPSATDESNPTPRQGERYNPPMAHLLAGAVFAGYRIEEVVGRGGMGFVYRATEARPERTVALKVIAPEFAADAAFRARFLRESEIAAKIEHPNVVPVSRVGEEDGMLFIAMRLIRGTDLGALIAAQGPLDALRAARIVDQVAGGLDAAHEQGFVHRDVKPANLLIEPGRRGDHVYLTDFGLTKRWASSGDLTQTGMVVGTTDYMAPEQWQGGRVDARADVYSLGCVLFEALTGRVPYPREGQPARMYAHLTAPPPIVSDLVPSAAQFDEIVRRALTKSPDDRYPSAGDLGLAALAAAEGRAVARAERSVATGQAAASTEQGAEELASAQLEATSKIQASLTSVRLALAAAAVIAAAVIASAFAGFVTSPGTSDPSTSVAPLSGSASAGPVQVAVPADWQRQAKTPTTVGLRLTNALAFVSGTRGQFVVGIAAAASSGASLLPTGFVSAPSSLRRQTVRLGRADFYRYVNVTPSGSTESENVYALPTSAGVVIAACKASAVSAAAFAATCERVLASLRLLSGRIRGLGPDSAYAGSLAASLGELTSSTRRYEPSLDRANTAGEQSRAASQLAGSYRHAAARVSAASPGPAEQPASAAIAAALTQTASAYASLASAAAHNNRGAFSRARTAVINATGALASAISRLAPLGYRTTS